MLVLLTFYAPLVVLATQEEEEEVTIAAGMLCLL